MKPSSAPHKPSKPGTRPAGFSTAGGRTTASPKGHPKPRETKPATVTASPAPAPQPSPPPTRSAPPMKKRAKGSGFLGLIFVGAFLALGYVAWSSLLQYQAFGRIEGRVISVGAPWDGSLSTWEVRDGELVNQGQVLARIKNLDMDHQLATYGDELKMNQAMLEAEMSKINFETHTLGQQNQKVLAEFHQTDAELRAEEQTFNELSAKYERARRLFKSNNLSRSAYETIFFKFAGQKKRIEHLTSAVEVLRTRSQNVIDRPDGAMRLKPLLAEIELTKYKIERLREKIEQGSIRSPATGRVSKRHLLTGESAKSSQVIIDILEDNSIEAVLYLPQRVVAEYEIGKTVEVSIEPYSHSLPCRVERFGDRFQTAPATIERYYQNNQPLLPVYLTPLHDTSEMLAARIGGTIKRPYDYSKSLKRLWDDTKSLATRITGNTQPHNPETDNRAVSPAKTVSFPAISSGISQPQFDLPAQQSISKQIRLAAPSGLAEPQDALFVGETDSIATLKSNNSLVDGEPVASEFEDLLEAPTNIEEESQLALPGESIESNGESTMTDQQLFEVGKPQQGSEQTSSLDTTSEFDANPPQAWRNSAASSNQKPEAIPSRVDTEKVIPPFPAMLLPSNSDSK